jgi:hypothetical protein
VRKPHHAFRAGALGEKQSAESRAAKIQRVVSLRLPLGVAGRATARSARLRHGLMSAISVAAIVSASLRAPV